ncbi:2Fe-2S iron-sulfur cluster-binding protein [Amycolatopsis sp. NPDC004368]
MPEITYVQPDGTARTVEAPLGHSLTRVAIENGVDRIMAECGGNAMCATCHVHADPERLDDLGPLCSDEEEMLDCTASPRAATSRLSCPLPVTEDLDGLVLRLPEEQ